RQQASRRDLVAGRVRLSLAQQFGEDGVTPEENGHGKSVEVVQHRKPPGVSGDLIKAPSSAIGDHGSACWSDSRTKSSAESMRGTHQFHKSPHAASTRRPSFFNCDEAQAPTPEMAVTPPSIGKSAPTTYAESSDARETASFAISN